MDSVCTVWTLETTKQTSYVAYPQALVASLRESTNSNVISERTNLKELARVTQLQ